MTRAYYNEHDPEKAEALRWLMRDGWIAPGDVDERDIRDVTPGELSGYAQCHFFAGIGLWSVAARRAGIPDDFPLWSGSCPCQPFSAAGRGDGVADERHLFPHWHWLVSQRRPHAVVGEQVASRDGLAWLDIVRAAMEGTAYAGGRSIYALRASGRPISVSGFTCAGWPTSRATDGEKNTRTAEGVEREIARKGTAQDLIQAATLAGWPTPDASLFNNSSSLETTQERRDRLKEKHGNSNGAGLVIATAALTAQHSAPEGPFAIRCEVRSTDSGPVLTGCSVEILTDQNSGLLDPAHSSWLQGIPAEMANCVRMAMRSTSKSRRRSSKP